MNMDKFRKLVAEVKTAKQMELPSDSITLDLIKSDFAEFCWTHAEELLAVSERARSYRAVLSEMAERKVPPEDHSLAWCASRARAALQTKGT